jgi:hypothetical protein
MRYSIYRLNRAAELLPAAMWCLRLHTRRAVEHCGDAQQMAQLFEKRQLGGLQESEKGSRAPGTELTGV